MCQKPRRFQNSSAETAGARQQFIFFTYYSSMAMVMLAGQLLSFWGAQGTCAERIVLAASVMVANIPRQGEGLAVFSGTRVWPWALKKVRTVWHIFFRTDAVRALMLLTGTGVILSVLGYLRGCGHVLEIDLRDASVVIVGPAVVGIILGALCVGNQVYRIGPARLI
jgi:hypothetical protein